MTERADSQNNKASGGVSPLGYRWQNGRLVIDESEAQVRKLIYELFLKHRRKRVVANLLNDLGYKTRSGSLFSDTAIDRLLRDTTAKGVRFENGRAIALDPIVPAELWEQANNLLGKKQARLPVHLFVGLAFCRCGLKMNINNLQNYICSRCQRKIRSNDLEEILVIQLSKIEGMTNRSVEEIWQYLSPKEKRILIENAVNRITIGRTDIHIKFAVPTHSYKTQGTLQQNPPIHESPETDPKQVTVNDPLLSETEAAKFLGISKMTLLRRRNAGNIGFYRVGSRILYSKEKHLIPFLDRCEK